jgi:hypothetical protein
MAVALGKVALPGVLVGVVVIEELVVVVALGILVVGVSLIILAVVVTPGIMVVVVVIGVLVIVIALGILVVDVIGEGLVIVGSKYGRVIVMLPLARSSSLPASPTAYSLLSLAMSPSYWCTSMDHGSCLYFVSFNLPPQTKKQDPPIHSAMATHRLHHPFNC